MKKQGKYIYISSLLVSLLLAFLLFNSGFLYLSVLAILFSDLVLLLLVSALTIAETVKRRTLFLIIAFLICFSYSSIFITLVIQKIITPMDVHDPLATSRRLLLDSYYSGMTRASEDSVHFKENQTLTAEEVVANTTIPVEQLEIHCLNTSDITCSFNAAHAWRDSDVFITVDCLTLPCKLIFEGEELRGR
ncbi:hypothetical protein DRN74_04210 [Candidatus Micrarchaeota archaeon]|nr:MAG: hypothetical protein DRN74_04210 [Candidatus Micrarchaeota archaeon]